LELFHTDACDTVVLVTGDTDLTPAVRTAAQVFPSKTVHFAFPYKRKNKELAQLTGNSFVIRKERIVAENRANRGQFPENGSDAEDAEYAFNDIWISKWFGWHSIPNREICSQTLDGKSGGRIH
jgi:hypothetical protein